MIIQDLNEVLRRHGLTPPSLEVLSASHNNYKALLMQPGGPIVGSATRVGHLDQKAADERCFEFLRLALTRRAHLAVAPEYCIPWETLEKAVDEETMPPEGAIWVLGCESITPRELQALVLRMPSTVRVIHEDLTGLDLSRTYLDAAALVFRTTNFDGQLICAIVIQFKTCPSRDSLFVEATGLICGTTVYKLSATRGPLSLCVVICSDAFQLTDVDRIQELINYSLLIHIQLNPNPRHHVYKAYRTTAFGLDQSDFDLLCLNWAANIQCLETDNGPTENWRNIGGSAWYLPLSRCNADDARVHPNHRSGLYYAYLKSSRRHVLFFHYEEGVFELDVPKVAVWGVHAIRANHTGPLMVAYWRWSKLLELWAEFEYADDGFEYLLKEHDDVATALEPLLDPVHPLHIERFLALCEGNISMKDDWHTASQLDSCTIDESEVLKRITVSMDKSPDAQEFRVSRLAKLAELSGILKNHSFPPLLRNLNDGEASFIYDSNIVHHNVISSCGMPATVVYLGERPSKQRREGIAKGLAQLLSRSQFTTGKRLSVLYRQNGIIQSEPIKPFVSIEAVDIVDNDITEVIADEFESSEGTGK